MASCVTQAQVAKLKLLTVHFWGLVGYVPMGFWGVGPLTCGGKDLLYQHGQGLPL